MSRISASIFFSILFLVNLSELYAQNQGEIYLENQEYKKANEYYSKLKNSGNTTSDVLIGLGKSYMGMKNYDNSIEYFEKAISVDENNSQYYHLLGEAQLQKLQNGSMFEKMRLAGQVKESYIKAVELDNTNTKARISLAYFYSEAPGIAGGSISKAKEHAKIVIGQNPKEGYELMASIFINDDEYELAVKELMKLEKAGVPSEQIYYRVGRMYQDIEEYDLAFQWFSKAISANVSYDQAYYQYARTGIFSEKNVDTSIEYIKRYLTMDILPDQTDSTRISWKSSANWRLGMLYELKNNEQFARQAYQEALRLNPNNKKAKEALDDLY